MSHRSGLGGKDNNNDEVEAITGKARHKGPGHGAAGNRAADGAYPQESIRLSLHEVHVWSALLELDEERLGGMRRLLAADELARAERLSVSRVRNRFIIARGYLRLILARYLEKEPREIPFAYGSQGKPELTREQAEDGLHFNLSHSGDLALYTVTLRRAVGIDVEEVSSDLPCLRLADRYFSPHEIAELKGLPGNLQKEAFYTCWTRKEAYLKACGAGLSMPLDSFDVSLVPGAPAALLTHRTCPDEVSRWRLADIPVPPGYRAALAVEGKGLDILCRQWPTINRLDNF